jgi:uncharacterized protein YbjT (DUF2867 family)
MRLVVFGSTGGTGPFVLREALARGHEVTAFARRAKAVPELSGLAGVVEGDARRPSPVSEAINGQDAAIVTVGGRGQPGVARDIASTVTAAMSELGVTRLVTTSSYAMVASKPYVLASLIRRIFAKTFADQQAADEVIQASPLDWTIARATRLVDKAATRPARLASELFDSGPYSLTRQAWATVLVNLAERNTYLHQIVNVTG